MPMKGTEFTVMTITGQPTTGAMPVRGTTTDDEGTTTWTAVFVPTETEDTDD